MDSKRYFYGILFSQIISFYRKKKNDTITNNLIGLVGLNYDSLSEFESFLRNN